MATTRKACLPASDIENRFVAALNATASVRVVGEALELRDKEGKIRMRLEALYLR
jgi:heat shock protein HslJ